MKLRKLHIEDYKMFKDFDISFVDEKDNPFPIVVLAGVNGSGKTTILEYMANSFDRLLSNYNKKDILEFQEHVNKNIVVWNHEEVVGFQRDVNYEKEKSKKHFHENPGSGYMSLTVIDGKSKSYHFDNVIYLPAGTNKIEDIKETIRQKYIDRAFEIDKPSEALKELHDYISDIFKGLALTFNLSSIDYNKKEVLFKDNNGVEFDINELSTGEKTLLSKVLYLYFEGYENKVILIDEPELSLHPSWQNKVLKIYENFAEKNNCQIIIATHSPHIIGSAKNEYLRILRKNEDGEIKVVEDLKAEGRDINSILFEVMEEVAYRPKEFDEKIDRLHIAIDNRKIEEANERLGELKKSYGENDEVVMEAQILIDMFSRDTE